MAFVSRLGNLLKQSGGKYANMGLSSPNSSLFQAIRSMSSAKLFVGGLAYGTDEMSLREAFQQYGEVIEARVITDRDSGRSRGFGFVSYTSTDAASTALQDMDGKELHGRRIRVNFAQEKPRPAFGGGGGGYGVGGYSGGGAYGGGSSYSGSGYSSGGGGGSYGGSIGGSNLGGYSGGAGGSGGVGGGGSGSGSSRGTQDWSVAAPSGGNEDGSEGDLDLDPEVDQWGDDNEDGDYANTSNK